MRASDAILFFGVNLIDRDGEPIFEEDEIFQSDHNYPAKDIYGWIAHKLGIDSSPIKVNKFLEALGVCIDFHCSSALPIPYIYAVRYLASRGRTIEIPDIHKYYEELKETVEEVSNRLGVDSDNIGWKLVSWKD